MTAAARLLEARARSVEELRRRLLATGYRTDLVDAVIQRLLAVGFLDDAAFARAWVESRDRARPRGERALRAELKAKGLADQLIADVLDERRAGATSTGPDGTEAAAADRLLARNERSLVRLDDPRQRRQRAWALLARSGFDSDVAAAAVERAERRLAGAASAPDADPPEPV